MGEGPTHQRPFVELSYGSQQLHIAHGSIVGIEAHDAVASDLADLLGARRAPHAGELRIGGRDCSKVTEATLRDLVFAAPHHAVLFSGSIAENLVVDGRADTDTGADDAAVLASGLAEVVARLPRGMQESVGESGGLLSGGQRQRLLLARALRTTQPVLVLHEPTTAIDPVTEAHIARSLAAHLHREGRTTLLITTSPILLGVCDTVMTLVPE